MAALLAVQLIDNELDQVAALDRKLPERAARDVAAAEHRQWVSLCDQQRAVIDEATTAIATAEQQSSALATKRARLEGQLKTIISPREAEALMKEIEALQMATDALEEQELEAMQRQADAEAELTALAGREPALLAAIDAAGAALAEASGRLDAEREALAARRATADASLSAEERAVYDALRKRHGGVGIVQLEGRRCSGCHLDLTAGEVDEVKAVPADQLAECPHCGRVIAR